MRINKYVAAASGMSRRKADEMIAAGRVAIDEKTADAGALVSDTALVTLDGKPLRINTETVTILLHKPVGYVCSRKGQGSKTIYELLPATYQALKPVGRLDKDSSGLILLTNDGTLAHELTHPRFQKEKKYEVKLDKELADPDYLTITKTGVKLEDGTSKLGLKKLHARGDSWIVTMHEGRNRQIRRTFEALGYRVLALHRTNFGKYELGSLRLGAIKTV